MCKLTLYTIGNNLINIDLQNKNVKYESMTLDNEIKTNFHYK